MTDIEQYLRENKPDMPEEGQFLIEANARLAKVEGVKECVDTDRSRGRIALIVALLSGLVLGCVATVFVVCFPLPALGGDWLFIAKAAGTLKEHKELLIALVAGCAFALGLVFMSKKTSVL